MTLNELAQYFESLQEEFDDFINNKGPQIIGKVAVDYFKESFENEGWEGERWQEVQRRMNTVVRNGREVPNPIRGAARDRKILTGETGDLGRSIEINAGETGNGKVQIWTDPQSFAGSDKDYARAHNEGTTTAGRNHNVVIPKRQFMAHSDILNDKIRDEIEKKLREMIGK
jgi:phage gpG-like protein